MADQPSEPATHVLHALVYGDDELGALHPVIECLNDRDDAHRDCKYSDTPEHDDCPKWNRYMAWRDDPDANLSPWQAPPRFDCGGWTSPDGHHLHPDAGCGVEWTLRYVGTDAIATAARLRSGEGFRVEWHEGCPLLTPAPRTVQPYSSATERDHDADGRPEGSAYQPLTTTRDQPTGGAS